MLGKGTDSKRGLQLMYRVLLYLLIPPGLVASSNPCSVSSYTYENADYRICYWLLPHMYDLSSARSQCLIEGSDIAFIPDIDALLFVLSLIPAKYPTYYTTCIYIGLTRANESQPFEWITHSSDFDNWKPSYPEMVVDKNCVIMEKSSGQFRNVLCSTHYGALCSKTEVKRCQNVKNVLYRKDGEDQELTGSCTQDFVSESRMICAALCAQQSDSCLSFNYDHATKTCSLNHDAANGHLTPRTGSSYFEKICS